MSTPVRKMVGIDIEDIKRISNLCEFALQIPDPTNNVELVNNISNYITGVFVKSINDDIVFTKTNKDWVLQCLRDNDFQQLIDEWKIMTSVD